MPSSLSLESMARLWMCLQKPLVSTLSEGPVFSRWGGADLFFHFLWSATCLFISSFRFGLHLTCCLGLHRLHSFRIIAFKKIGDDPIRAIPSVSLHVGRGEMLSQISQEWRPLQSNTKAATCCNALHSETKCIDGYNCPATVNQTPK